MARRSLLRAMSVQRPILEMNRSIIAYYTAPPQILLPLGDSIPRLIENSGEIPCIVRLGGFCSAHDSWRIPHRRRSQQADRVGARWLGGVSGDATGKRLGAFG